MNDKVIKEYVKELDELQKMSSPSYKGKASVVRGGLAMTDERLGKMRIMMRNIVFGFSQSNAAMRLVREMEQTIFWRP